MLSRFVSQDANNEHLQTWTTERMKGPMEFRAAGSRSKALSSSSDVGRACVRVVLVC
jgi:hypothetical protein